MADKIYTPVAPRAKYYDENPRAKLSSSEEGMYNEVLAHFTKEGYALPNVEKGELTEKEKFWLSRESLLRYLRASKWKVTTAIQRLEATLKWRRDYGLYDKITAEYVEPEAVTGKEILFGYDLKGRPAFYMIPSRQNTDDQVRQNQFAVWMLERCIDSMEAGVETVDLLINFAQRAKHPALGQAKQFLNILQDHYPERLGLALVLNIPFLVSAFFKLISPFIDPVTRDKLKFNPKVVEDGIYDKDMLMKEWWGGDRDFEYVHEKYWPELVKNCEGNVEKWTAKWRVLGGTVGISEWAYKGGDDDKEKEEVEAAVVEETVVIPSNEEKKAGALAAVAVTTAVIAAGPTEDGKKDDTPEVNVAAATVVVEVPAEEVKKAEETKLKDSDAAVQGGPAGGQSTGGAVGAGAVSGSGGDAAAAADGGGGE